MTYRVYLHTIAQAHTAVVFRIQNVVTQSWSVITLREAGNRLATSQNGNRRIMKERKS